MHSPFPHPDIKIGEIYNLRIHVIGKSEDFIIARPITQNGGYATCGFLEILHKYAPSFTPIHSEHGTSLSRRSSVGAETEVPTTKHDHTRLFKKGDKVRIVKYNGRKFNAAPPTFQLGKVYSVDEDENTEHCYVMLQSCDLYYAHPVAFLELVNPAEELEPYKLIDSPNTYNIVRGSAMVMTIHKKSHPNAKDAAEAERDRLNAEWRKEAAND